MAIVARLAWEVPRDCWLRYDLPSAKQQQLTLSFHGTTGSGHVARRYCGVVCSQWLGQGSHPPGPPSPATVPAFLILWPQGVLAVPVRATGPASSFMYAVAAWPPAMCLRSAPSGPPPSRGQGQLQTYLTESS